MLVSGINYILSWVQVISGGRRYTCPMKEVDGVLLFKFKKEWHKVMEFAAENVYELKKNM